MGDWKTGREDIEEDREDDTGINENEKKFLSDGIIVSRSGDLPRLLPPDGFPVVFYNHYSFLHAFLGLRLSARWKGASGLPNCANKRRSCE
jgi:hypothetical protein